MKFKVWLAVAVVLAGCAGPVPGARPDRISLSSETLAVVFSDGITCRADIAAAPAGRLRDCPHPLDYAVTIERQSHLAALGDLFSPYGTVVLRDGAGRDWHWRSPASRERERGRPR
jgi:hypothetical protein